MCIIVVQMGTKKITVEECKNAIEQNKDGFGFVLQKGKKFYIYKTLNKDKALNFYAQNRDSVIALHFRYATMGAKTLKNVQPFTVEDLQKNYNDADEVFYEVRGRVFAHNGSIAGLGNTEKSDSLELFRITQNIPFSDFYALLHVLGNQRFFVMDLHEGKYVYTTINFFEEDAHNKFYASNMCYKTYSGERDIPLRYKHTKIFKGGGNNIWKKRHWGGYDFDDDYRHLWDY